VNSIIKKTLRKKAKPIASKTKITSPKKPKPTKTPAKTFLAIRSKSENTTLQPVSRSAGCFGCYVTCPNAVSSRVIHLVFHRH
jgi:hypothetical protein